MKKFITILFTLLYLIPAIGFSVDLHKCGSKIKVVSVNSAHESKCPCGSEMPSGCCADVHLSVKIADAQKCSTGTTCPRCVELKLAQIHVAVMTWISSFQSEVFNFISYHAPPFKNKLPVHLVNSIFRI